MKIKKIKWKPTLMAMAQDTSTLWFHFTQMVWDINTAIWNVLKSEAERQRGNKTVKINYFCTISYENYLLLKQLNSLFGSRQNERNVYFYCFIWKQIKILKEVWKVKMSFVQEPRRPRHVERVFCANCIMLVWSD